MRAICTLIFVCISLFGFSQEDDIRLFIFGNSTIDHRPPLFETPSDETTTPHWHFELADHENQSIAVSGQYGFLPQFINLPPFSQWGYDIVPPVWESDYEPFDAADFTHIMLTAANFIQWQGPDEEYYTDPGVTPLNATETVFDWCDEQEENLRFYIYENWPDMAPYLSDGFPPTETEFSEYNDFCTEEFHDWWIEYHDSLLLSRPEFYVRLIPVGPLISEILSDPVFENISITELYEDDAPHGRANVYFLASLIQFMAINQQPAPLDFELPDLIDQTLIDNYEYLVNFIWEYLIDFNDPSGESRVFYDLMVNDVDIEIDTEGISLYPNPFDNFIQISGISDQVTLEILSSDGSLYTTIDTNQNIHIIDLDDLPSGIHFIKIVDVDNANVYLERIIKM